MLLNLLLSLTLGSVSPEVRQKSYVTCGRIPHLAALVSLAGYSHPDIQVRKYAELLWPTRFSKYCRVSRILGSSLYENDYSVLEELAIHMADLGLVTPSPLPEPVVYPPCPLPEGLARGLVNWQIVHLVPGPTWLTLDAWVGRILRCHARTQAR